MYGDGIVVVVGRGGDVLTYVWEPWKGGRTLVEGCNGVLIDKKHCIAGNVLNYGSSANKELV